MPSRSPSDTLASVRDLVNRLLVADVFLVLAGAGWFLVAVLLHSRAVDTPLELFMTLWEPLFTPAIGLLIVASLISGLLNWLQRQGLGQSQDSGS